MTRKIVKINSKEEIKKYRLFKREVDKIRKLIPSKSNLLFKKDKKYWYVLAGVKTESEFYPKGKRFADVVVLKKLIES